jgi:5-methylcytosine-specific restriction endonuclease McrA
VTSHGYRFKNAWRTTTRKATLAKTGGCCALCGWSGTDGHGKGLHQAHLVADQHGGPATSSNLVPLCPPCHRRYDAGQQKRTT